LGPPQPRDDQLDIFGLTHQGKVRTENQDHFLLCSLHRSIRVHSTSLPDRTLLEMPGERLAFLGMVADGVGGSTGGEEASRAAIEAIAIYSSRAMDCYYAAHPGNHDALLEALQDAGRDSHEKVIARKRERPELDGMATTLTLAFSVWPSLFLLQVGDSRAYLLRDGSLRRLTRDQTLAQDLVDDGVLTESRADLSPFAHVLSSAIGSNARPVVTRHESEVSDVVLLCTDGLTKHVSERRIVEQLLANPSSRRACEALVQDALDGGGTDNVTVLIGRARPDGRP
jgi:protein phosphatase